MGAISKYGKRLVGKYFYFGFTDHINVIGKIKNITVGKDYRRLPTANYSLVCISSNGPRDLWTTQFNLGSIVDKQCIVFNESGNIAEFFKLFFDFGDSNV